MNKTELEYFYKNYPVFYHAKLNEKQGKENDSFFIIKTRLPDESMALIMPNEDQAKQILKEKEKIRLNEKRRLLSSNIEKSKKNILKTFAYYLLPFLNKRFYEEIKVSGISGNEEEINKKIDEIISEDQFSDGDLEKYTFNNLKLSSPVSVYIVIKESNNVNIKTGMYKITTSNIFYIVDDNAFQIRIAFQSYLNSEQIRGEEQRDGSILLTSEFDGVAELFLDFNKAKNVQSKFMEEKAEKIKQSINDAKKELKDLQSEITEFKKTEENNFKK